MSKYKTYEELKEELGKNYDKLMYEINLELIKQKDEAIDKIQYIIDYGFDYDGFNNVDDLKGLIDMLVDYAVQSKNILQGEDKDE